MKKYKKIPEDFLDVQELSALESKTLIGGNASDNKEIDEAKKKKNKIGDIT